MTARSGWLVCGGAVRSLRVAVLAVLMAGPIGASAAPWQLDVDEPRAYGYTVGDTVRRRVAVEVAPGYTLDEATVPSAGRRGVPIELRHVSQQLHRHGAGTRLELVLDYQVFIAPRAVRTLELPTFTLGFKGEPRQQDVRVDAWPLTVSPLVPVEVSPRRGLGELQPDAPTPPLDMRAAHWRLVAYGAIATLLMAYLAYVYLGVPWLVRRQRPFTAAWRELDAMQSSGGAGALGTAESQAQRRVAFQHVHTALNRSAGEVVFEGSIARFVAAHPRFAGLRGELVEFFQRSRGEFFGEASQADNQAATRWLLDFCRRCRDAERGSA